MPKAPPSRPAADIDLALAHLAGSSGSLVAEGVSVAFGGVIAVAGVDLIAPVSYTHLAFDFSFDVVMAMPCSKLEEEPTVTCPETTCPGAHKKLD